MNASPTAPRARHDIVVVGGGAAGLAVAAGLIRDGARDVLVVEPSDRHCYQPLWTLVGAGVVPRAASARPMAEVMPLQATWHRAAVREFDPEHSALTTDDGRRIEYEFLVVAAGIEADWARIRGLPAALDAPGVCSNYSFETVERTWQAIRGFDGGNAVFTFPRPPIKCAGAPQKIMYLAEHAFRRRGVRDRARVHYYCATPTIFSAPHYARALMEQVVPTRGIETHFRHELVEVRVASREAVFHDLEGDTELVQPYDMLHVAPPMRTPAAVRASALANADGYVEVDRHSLRHVRYPNVFALGDASSLPTSKTAAAVRAQLPVLLANLRSARFGGGAVAAYDGYTSCPLVTGYGSLILAEFDYDLAPRETFPFDQSKERRSMYWLKRHVLPVIYWQGLLRGARWPVPRNTALD